jgi:hypothetical protein
MSRRRRRAEPRIEGEGETGQDSLRRVEAFVVAYSLLGALAFVAAGRGRGAFVLTLLGAAAIVAFRSLQGLVARLHADRMGRIGFGLTLLLLLRSALLTGTVVAALVWGRDNVWALVAGVSTLPAALLTEAGILLAKGLRE